MAVTPQFIFVYGVENIDLTKTKNVTKNIISKHTIQDNILSNQTTASTNSSKHNKMLTLLMEHSNKTN